MGNASNGIINNGSGADAVTLVFGGNAPSPFGDATVGGAGNAGAINGGAGLAETITVTGGEGEKGGAGNVGAINGQGGADIITATTGPALPDPSNVGAGNSGTINGGDGPDALTAIGNPANAGTLDGGPGIDTCIPPNQGNVINCEL